jgi:FMN-dependent oxidoreductase (nitrilotriacetate monooxygenase family)
MTQSKQRQMSLVAFVQASNCSVYTGSWRHPEGMDDYLTPEFYQRIARTLEDGCFDLMFFDDRLSMPDMYGGDYRETIANGVRAVKMDPVAPLMAMAAATKHLGLGCTYSTTYYEPFHVARLFATMDLMTRGRVAWNIVTSVNDSEAENMGRVEHMEHDLRYDRADEFLEVVLGHWDSWEDDALINDKAGGRFADPDKVHKLAHKGRWFQSKGPLAVPRSRQGHPVLLQAGGSGRGMRFASQWSDFVFTLYMNHEAGRKQYKAYRDAAAAAGRDPDTMKIAPAMRVIVANSESEAREKYDFIDSLARPIDTLALLCELLNVDFAKFPYDEPLSDEAMAALSMQTMRDQVVTKSGKRNPTPRDFVELSGRGTLREGPTLVGTPKQVADEMEAWFSDACDGFVMYSTHLPGSFEDITRLLVPELQRRGLFRKEYPGTTLRETLGLARPQPREWRKRTRI